MTTPEPEAVSLEVGGTEVRLRWDGSEWELASAPDWSRLEAIRLVSATFDDGAVLGVAAARPRDARGHGDDAVAARLVDAEELRTSTSDVLVSVEYDPQRRPRRLGLELWPDSDSPPIRVAANREPDAGDADRVPMRFKLGGVAGRGTYETLSRD